VRYLAPGVWRLKEVPAPSINVYLAEDVLIDAGRRWDRRRIFAVWRDAVAPFQRKKPTTKASRKSNTSGSTPQMLRWASGQSSTAIAVTRPPQAATTVARDALLVPQRAVRELQGMSQVPVVGADNKVEVKTVTLGQQSGDRWIVAEGLEPGARVVVDAPQIRAGTVVTPAVLAASRVAASGAGQR